MEEQPKRTPERTGDEPRGSASRRIRLKSEDEMSTGADHAMENGEARFEYDPANRRTPEEGGEPQ